MRVPPPRTINDPGIVIGNVNNFLFNWLNDDVAFLFNNDEIFVVFEIAMLLGFLTQILHT